MRHQNRIGRKEFLNLWSKNSDFSPHVQDEARPENEENSDSDGEFAVRGTRPLSDIYARCNVVVNDCSWFTDAASVQDWLDMWMSPPNVSIRSDGVTHFTVTHFADIFYAITVI